MNSGKILHNITILTNESFGSLFYFSSTKYDKIVVTEFVMISINITILHNWRMHK